jgi:arabinan endo-1,5-alpha-L-arabinosidase
MRTESDMKLMLMMHTFLFVFLNTALTQPVVHDPSHMVKDGDRYFIFNTGNGVECKSADSTDFVNWRNEPDIFPVPGWPAWINNYAPNFGGNFWAPEIIYMNGLWHVYYSATHEFGNNVSTIGVVTTPSLVDRNWADSGMVVYSLDNSNYNAIDADIYRDNDGKVWLLFGSYWGGIYVTELDTLTGKPLDRNNLHNVANGNIEAGNVIAHGNYYYLFFNRGRCCSGIHSTYQIVMGRSTNPTGPFYDMDSIATNNDGGSLFLHSDGRFIGPGHFGYGENKLTYHYYDGLANGAARLKVADLQWEDDWPVAVYSRSGHPATGNFVIYNNSTKKVLQLENGDTISGTNVSQFTETGDTIQQWELSYVGNGYYKISPVLSPGKALEIEGGSTSAGANVQIGAYEGAAHQQWYFANMGSYIFRIMNRKSRRALEIAIGSAVDGANAQQNTYRDNRLYQRWRFKEPTIIESVNNISDGENGFTLYPNPSAGSFTIDVNPLVTNRKILVEMYTSDGKRIYSKTYVNTKIITFTDQLDKGIYLVNIITDNQIMTQKLLVK